MGRAAIIGAGASGLVAAKELLADGHEVRVFEKRPGLGGLFNIAMKECEGCSVYEGVHLTISARQMEFSDFPGDRLTGGVAPTWSHHQYLQYLNDYSAHFGVDKFIQYSTAVLNCVKLPDGRWNVTTQADGAEALTEEYDFLAVCSGTHQKPKLPAFLKDSPFLGEIMHSSKYLDNKPFVGKRVVCIGLGESGADISREISDVASSCTLALRSWPYVIPRALFHVHGSDSFTARIFYPEYLFGWCRWIVAPLTFLLFTMPILSLGFFLKRAACWLGGLKVWSPGPMSLDSRAKVPVDTFGQKRGAGAEPSYVDKDFKWSDVYELERQYWLYKCQNTHTTKFATKNTTFMKNVIEGKLAVSDAGICHLEENAVVMKDGTRIEADAIMCCTGYYDEIHFINGWKLPGGDVRNMYKNAFDATLGPTVCFIGWARPSTGGIPACSEMTARVFSAMCSGRVVMPPADEMRTLIASEKAAHDAQFHASPEVRTVVCFIEHMDALGAMIGCVPKLSSYLFKPMFLFNLIMAGASPAQWRLRGPHSTPALAEKTIQQTSGGWQTLSGVAVWGLCGYVFHYWLGLNDANHMWLIPTRNPKGDFDKAGPKNGSYAELSKEVKAAGAAGAPFRYY